MSTLSWRLESQAKKSEEKEAEVVSGAETESSLSTTSISQVTPAVSALLVVS